MKMSGAQAMIKCLEKEKVNVLFGYPGAAICPFYDALLDSSIRHILVRHEQNAAHAASGYARVTGKTGVCVATSGPGATNLITGIATAYMDSIPMVAITGQVSSELIGRDVFQEADITGATEPFCKHNYLVKRVEDIPRIFKEAFHIASTGRPGPVLVDIPIDIQNKELQFKYPEEVSIKGYKPTYKGHSLQIRKISEAIKKAKAPVICAGGGIVSSGAQEELKKLVDKCSIPVATTMMGIGSLPVDHPMNLGMLGTHGGYAANHAVYNTDLLIIIGARVGDRALGAAHKIAEKADIIHIDIDPAEIGKNIGTTIPIVGDARLILQDLNSMVEKGEADAWAAEVKKWKKERTKPFNIEGSQFVKPQYVLSKLSELLEEDTIVTTEVGQNQIWAANYCRVKNPKGFVTSGGMGTMGYGLPSAVGAKVGSPRSKVIAICGDGSFQMSMQELGTIKQEKLGIKVIILNNSRLGMVRELQKNLYKSRYSAVLLESNPDFIKLAEAYGMEGKRISENSQVEDALKEMLEDDRPYMLEFVIDPEEGTL